VTDGGGVSLSGEKNWDGLAEKDIRQRRHLSGNNGIHIEERGSLFSEKKIRSPERELDEYTKKGGGAVQG